MPFIVVQTRKTKRSRPVLTIVPSKWVSDDCVYWPPTNFITLSANGDSEPIKDVWQKQKCKVVGRAHTYKSAEEVVRKLESVTDSEDAAQSSLGTRAHPGRKKAKFQSKTYQLATPQFKSPEVITYVTPPADSSLKRSDADAGEPSCSYRQPPLVHHSLSSSVCSSPTNTVDTFSTTISSVNIDPSIHHSAATVYSSGSGTSYTQRMLYQNNSEVINNPKSQGHTTNDLPMNRNSAAPKDIIPIEHTLPPQINHQDRTNEFGINISEPLQIIQSVDGKQYVRLQNGCYVEVMTEQSNSEPPVSPIKANVIDVPEENKTTALNDILERLTRIEFCLQKITLFMADVSKFMEARTEAPLKTSNLRKKAENFEDMEILFPINDEAKLQSIEASLSNQVFFEKLTRYISVQYELNGKRDGKAIFKTVIRKMIAPNVFLPYSWMGSSKKSSEDREPNKGFKVSFPNIVRFFEGLLREADIAFTNEAVHKAFSDHLRQKYTEMNRAASGVECRIPSSRVRLRKPKMEQIQDEDEDTCFSEINETSQSSASSDDNSNANV